MYQLQQERRLPGTEQWKIRIFTPGEQPLVSFATAFLDEEVTDIERARQLKAAAEAIAALLVRTPVSRDRTSAGEIVQPFFKLFNRFPNCSTVFSVYNRNEERSLQLRTSRSERSKRELVEIARPTWV